jgi:hypothetical protein
MLLEFWVDEEKHSEEKTAAKKRGVRKKNKSLVIKRCDKCLKTSLVIKECQKTKSFVIKCGVTKVPKTKKVLSSSVV